jgi:hypothetical protein
MKSIEEQLEEYKKFNEAKNAFFAGMVRGWADQLESGSMTDRIRIVEDMKEFSERIAKSAGVIIANDSDL